jgi:hypothetical protein
MACAGSIAELAAWYQRQQLRFEDRLIRIREGRLCHLYYLPSIPGFRAQPDNQPVSELFLDVLLPGFLGLQPERFGDVLDISRQMLPLIPRPLRVSIGMPQDQDPRFYQEALRFHYPASPHAFSFRNNRSDQRNPWVQDYLKSGLAGGRSQVLVTRLSFEGRAENAALMKPLLDSLREPRFVRSRLSWDGGDLQFVRSPKDSRRILLFYGKSARKYWGARMSDEEFAYVLKTEFGADDAVELSDVTSHVDYFVAFLPEDNIALVSQPEHGNYGIAKAAADLLAAHYERVPRAEVTELARLLARPEAAFTSNPEAIRLILRAIVENSPRWPLPFNDSLARRVAAYAESSCAGKASECAGPAGIARLLNLDRLLLRDWAKGSSSVLISQALAPRIAAIIESQLPGFAGSMQPAVDANAAKLEALGFRVIRVPRLAGDPALKPMWPGVSYVNATLIDRTLFMPEFGLGEAEWALFDRMRGQIPARYRIVPVYARQVLLYNGGIHCVSGLIRDTTTERAGKPPGPSSPPR